MAKTSPRQILGNWRKGFALDVHTVSSTPIGYNEFGHMQFDTLRSEVGELLYKLKNKGDKSVVTEIAAAAVELVKPSIQKIDLIVPVPPSTQRSVQPVKLLAAAIGEKLNIPVVEAVTKTKDTPQLKNVYDLDERAKILKGAFSISDAVKGKRVLLFDDLYRSGATMNAITEALIDQGKAADVMALTITKTRSNQ
jgi:predicted amidophosphoribosyltransferase